MNKKFFIAWLVVFVVWMMGSFVIHGMLLHADYMQLPQLYRSEADSGAYFPFLLLAHVLMAGSMVWIYAQGVNGKPWLGQGLRFGLALVLLVMAPMYLIYYAVQPTPGMLVVKQVVFNGVLALVLGVVVGFLYRDAG